jgi:predicted Abi (CAAX) family protease
MLIQTLIGRVIASITKGLSLEDWVTILIILGLFAAFTIPIGLKTGWLYRTPLPRSLKNKIISMVKVLIIPVIPEELLFRVIFLPHPFLEKVTEIQWILAATISLSIFILYHPLLAKTFYKPGYPLFFDPIFLVQAGLLGLACTMAYWLTGSLWGILLIHWVIDWLWLYTLGGRAKLTGDHLL